MASVRSPVHCDESNIKEILSKYSTVVLDLDGVVWSLDHLTPLSGVGDALTKLQQMGKKLIFITNNCVKERGQLQESMKRLANYEAAYDDIFPSSRLAALYIRHIAKISGKCYALGNKALQGELDDAGVQCVGTGEEAEASLGKDITRDLFRMTFDPDVQAVVVGWDTSYNFSKMTKAVNYLSKPECLFVAAMSEAHANVRGRLLPLTAGIIGSISSTIDRQPLLITKPNHVAFECLQAHYPALRPETTLMIGDMPDADMKFAENAGIDSLMVFTGAGTLDDIKDMQARGETHVPNYIIASLGELNKYL